MSTSRGQYILEYIDVENWEVVYAQWKATGYNGRRSSVEIGDFQGYII
jgi:hypothetical protein